MRHKLLITSCSILILFAVLTVFPLPSYSISVNYRLFKTAIKLTSPSRKSFSPSSSNVDNAESTYHIMKHVSGSNVIESAERYIKKRMPYYPILDLALQVSGYGQSSPTIYVMRKRFNRLKGTVYMKNMLKKYHIYRRTGQEVTANKKRYEEGLKVIQAAVEIMKLRGKHQSSSSI